MENNFNEKQARADYQKVIKSSTINKIQIFIGLFGLIALIGFFSSFIFWIWYGWSIAWKIGLTSIVVVVISRFLQESFNRGLKKAEDDYIQILKNNIDISYTPTGIKKSKFQKRLEEMAEERKRKNNL